MIQAVIFDMDGLLMDSEREGLYVLQECGRKQGLELPLDLIKSTLGTTYAHSKALYKGIYGDKVDPEQLFVDFKAGMRELAEQGKVPLKKGARELLEYLGAHHIPCAVASSSPLVMIRLYLGKTGVLDHFQALLSGDNGFPSKPAPDMFLGAAKALNMDPALCLVLEDSVNGVKAGRSAGMQVGMVPDILPYKEELKPYCDYVLSDLSAVIPLLAR